MTPAASAGLRVDPLPMTAFQVFFKRPVVDSVSFPPLQCSGVHAGLAFNLSLSYSHLIQKQIPSI